MAQKAGRAQIPVKRRLPVPSVCGRRNRSEGKSMRALNVITLVLLIVGGLNWGLVGLFDFDLVAALFGEKSTLARIVYILVGLSAVWQIIPLLKGDRQ